MQDGIKLSLAPGGAAAPVAVGDTNRPNGLTTGGAAPAPSGPVAPRSMTTRLLLDCMGHYRWGEGRPWRDEGRPWREAGKEGH